MVISGYCKDGTTIDADSSEKFGCATFLTPVLTKLQFDRGDEGHLLLSIKRSAVAHTLPTLHSCHYNTRIGPGPREPSGHFLAEG